MKALENMAIGQTADVSDIITWPVYFLVPIVFILLATLYLLDAVLIARDQRTRARPCHRPTGRARTTDTRTY